ncbi:uncharacterized protein LOC111815167 [Octodon degus]|uniref:Uncharacterized protein LOC111815167 n=1 Tax=Octodon degus TaxID=10160 RepID=A0A6P6DZ90_OCTDE|nr:uncharacterized protein LOC111815167 [Octodon degus]
MRTDYGRACKVSKEERHWRLILVVQELQPENAILKFYKHFNIHYYHLFLCETLPEFPGCSSVLLGHFWRPVGGSTPSRDFDLGFANSSQRPASCPLLPRVSHPRWPLRGSQPQGRPELRGAAARKTRSPESPPVRLLVAPLWACAARLEVAASGLQLQTSRQRSSAVSPGREEGRRAGGRAGTVLARDSPSSSERDFAAALSSARDPEGAGQVGSPSCRRPSARLAAPRGPEKPEIELRPLCLPGKLFLHWFSRVDTEDRFLLTDLYSTDLEATCNIFLIGLKWRLMKWSSSSLSRTGD